MNSDERPNPDRSLEALKARLRALPQPPIPPSLEVRLLACVPADREIGPRWRVVMIAMLSVAAACLLAFLAFAWYPHLRENHSALPGMSQPVQSDTPQSSFDTPSLAALREDHRLLDEDKLPTFTWPLDDTVTIRPLSPIPADLLD